MKKTKNQNGGLCRQGPANYTSSPAPRVLKAFSSPVEHALPSMAIPDVREDVLKAGMYLDQKTKEFFLFCFENNI
jgi:hypothetical protein